MSQIFFNLQRKRAKKMGLIFLIYMEDRLPQEGHTSIYINTSNVISNIANEV